MRRTSSPYASPTQQEVESRQTPPTDLDDMLSPENIARAVEGLTFGRQPTTPPTPPLIGVGAQNVAPPQDQVIDEGDATTLTDTADLVRTTLDLFREPNLDQDIFDEFTAGLEQNNPPVYNEVIETLQAQPEGPSQTPRADDFLPPAGIGQGTTQPPPTVSVPTTTQPPPLIPATTQPTPRGRGRGRVRGRGRRRATTARTAGRTTRMNQGDLQQQLNLLLKDQPQTAAGRRIAGITTTNTITTTYKDVGRPQVRRTSTSVRN